MNINNSKTLHFLNFQHAIPKIHHDDVRYGRIKELFMFSEFEAIHGSFKNLYRRHAIYLGST